MNKRKNILRNLPSLHTFEPTSPKNVYYINCLTKNETMTKLIELASERREFLLEIKYDIFRERPDLIQILFAHKFVLHIILVETMYLPKHNLDLHNQIVSLFSIILSPLNIIQSWDDIKTDLIFFLDCQIFTFHQIQNIKLISIQKKFQKWFKDNFADIKLNGIPSEYWTLTMALGFVDQRYFDTSLSHSGDWDIGLFAHFETVSDNPSDQGKASVRKLINENKRRLRLNKYVIDECIAINNIAALLQNDWTQKQAKNYLKKYYNNS